MYLGEDFKENIEWAFKGRLPEKPSIYMYCPTSIDETMAKEGNECLSIVVRVPNLLFNDIDWDEKTIQTLRQRVLNSIAKIDGLEDIEQNIVYESYLTPKDLLNNYNSYGGTAFGLSHTLTQTNYFRPHIKCPTVKNLYFVGSSVHPGTGVSIVLLGSSLVAGEILRDEG
jgi:phytoene desaturase